MLTLEKGKAKETVFTKDMLAGLGTEQLKEILFERGITNPHWKATDDTLRGYILQGNPTGGSESQSTSQTVATSGSDVVADDRDKNEIFAAFKEKEQQAVAKSLHTPIKPEQKVNSGIVVLELVNPKKTGSIRVRDYTGPDGEIRQLKDKHGKSIMVSVTKNRKLDLSNENDRLFYEHIKDHPIYVLGGSPCFRLINTELNAINNIDRVELAIDAKMIIKSQSEGTLRDLARLLGLIFNTTTTSAVLKDLLYQEAENNPQVVLEKWNHPDRELHTLAYKAMDKGVISKNKGVYTLGDATLGISFETVVLWLKQNEDMIPHLRTKVA